MQVLKRNPLPHSLLLWLVLLAALWACLGAQTLGLKTASGQIYGPQAASWDATPLQAAPRLGLRVSDSESVSAPPVGANGGVVADEAAALSRIGGNANGPVLNGKAPNTVLLQQAENLSTAKPFQSTVPRDLNEQALWNRVLADPSAGRPLPQLSGDQRFAQSAGFTKMEASHRLPDGSSVSIHYQYNSVTGKAYDIKIVTPQPSVLQPGPSFTPKK
jgi:hypothetical protein